MNWGGFRRLEVEPLIVKTFTVCYFRRHIGLISVPISGLRGQCGTFQSVPTVSLWKLKVFVSPDERSSLGLGHTLASDCFQGLIWSKSLGFPALTLKSSLLSSTELIAVFFLDVWLLCSLSTIAQRPDMHHWHYACCASKYITEIYEKLAQARPQDASNLTQFSCTKGLLSVLGASALSAAADPDKGP